MTKFFRTHPVGPDIIEEWAGKDATKIFNEAGHTAAQKKEMEQYFVGEYVEPRKFSKLEDLAEHSQVGNLWLLLHGKVYDVSSFKHPGGSEILAQNAGQDATTQFEDINHSAKAQDLMKAMYIGDFINLEDEKESWDKFQNRKEQEDSGQLVLWQKLILVALFIAVFLSLYSYLTAPK